MRDLVLQEMVKIIVVCYIKKRTIKIQIYNYNLIKYKVVYGCIIFYIYLYYILTLYHTCTYNRLPEDDPSASKQVEDVKN
jgi:hypothetical protein